MLDNLFYEAENMEFDILAAFAHTAPNFFKDVCDIRALRAPGELSVYTYTFHVRGNMLIQYQTTTALMAPRISAHAEKQNNN